MTITTTTDKTMAKSKRITISDIARDLNTTPATVSRALQNHPRISFKTKKKITDYANKVGYNINKIASSLRSGKSHVIGVMIPSAQINFFGSVLHGIEAIATQEGYSILIYQTMEKTTYELKGLETFMAARVDGILVSVSKETTDYTHFMDIKQKGVPIAFFDRSVDGLGICSIVLNDYKGGYMATSHLIEQGYTRIAHVTGPLHMKVFYDRYLGYKAALKDHNMPFDERLICKGNISVQSGIDAAKYYVKNKLHPDAIFAVEDFTALGVIKEYKTRGVKFPAELGVIGFANELMDEHITPTLSSIDQQTVKMGKESLKLILEIIQTQDSKNYVPEKKRILEPILRFRESTNLRESHG